IRRTKLFKPGFERVANLPLNIRRYTNPAGASQLFDARSDVDTVAIHVAVAVNHVADVDADFQFNPPVRCDVMIALRQGALDFNGALRRFQGAAEFDEKSIANGFDLGAVEPGKNFTEKATVFFQQFDSELIVTLGQGTVAHHVSEHDGGKFPLLCVLGRHERTKAETARNEMEFAGLKQLEICPVPIKVINQNESPCHTNQLNRSVCFHMSSRSGLARFSTNIFHRRPFRLRSCFGLTPSDAPWAEVSRKTR